MTLIKSIQYVPAGSTFISTRRDAGRWAVFGYVAHHSMLNQHTQLLKLHTAKKKTKCRSISYMLTLATKKKMYWNVNSVKFKQFLRYSEFRNTV